MYRFTEINRLRYKKVVQKMGTRTSPLPSYSTMNSLLLLSLLAVGAVAHRPDLTINNIPEARTPPASLAECQPLLITFAGGTPPYTILDSDVDTDPVSASHLADFENVSGTAITWPAVNASQGTQLLISIEDSTGLTRTTPPFPVTQGSGDGCLAAGSGGYSPRGAPLPEP
ncbi:hypothetical protein R3P38DRAFT_3620333 [Favolaschia claudopus]|uniref:Uncharacterized protein n=1 Tax=Favolaschia claudopus TaxID=2862362 RepID=A0AAW0DCN0_9AGAR